MENFQYGGEYERDFSQENYFSSSARDNNQYLPTTEVWTVLNPKTGECFFPTTALTLRSDIPALVEYYGFSVLDLICRQIIANSLPFKQNENNFQYYLILLFYFFPIFLTGSTRKRNLHEIQSNLENFYNYGTLPAIELPSEERIARRKRRAAKAKCTPAAKLERDLRASTTNTYRIISKENNKGAKMVH